MIENFPSVRGVPITVAAGSGTCPVSTHPNGKHTASHGQTPHHARILVLPEGPEEVLAGPNRGGPGTPERDHCSRTRVGVGTVHLCVVLEHGLESNPEVLVCAVEVGLGDATLGRGLDGLSLLPSQVEQCLDLRTPQGQVLI